MSRKDDSRTPLEAETEPDERAAKNIAAWEKKRAAEVDTARDGLGDDAEAGGP